VALGAGVLGFAEDGVAAGFADRRGRRTRGDGETDEVSARSAAGTSRARRRPRDGRRWVIAYHFGRTGRRAAISASTSSSSFRASSSHVACREGEAVRYNSRRVRSPRQVVVYSRKGCHLCEVVKESLTKLSRRGGFTWQEVDVEATPNCRRQFSDEVPVVSSTVVKAFSIPHGRAGVSAQASQLTPFAKVNSDCLCHDTHVFP